MVLSRQINFFQKKLTELQTLFFTVFQDDKYSYQQFSARMLIIKSVFSWKYFGGNHKLLTFAMQ